MFTDICMKATESHLPGVFNVPGEDAFDTNDLVSEHPTEKGLYRVVGRLESDFHQFKHLII